MDFKGAIENGGPDFYNTAHPEKKKNWCVIERTAKFRGARKTKIFAGREAVPV